MVAVLLELGRPCRALALLDRLRASAPRPARRVPDRVQRRRLLFWTLFASCASTKSTPLPQCSCRMVCITLLVVLTVALCLVCPNSGFRQGAKLAFAFGVAAVYLRTFRFCKASLSQLPTLSHPRLSVPRVHTYPTADIYPNTTPPRHPTIHALCVHTMIGGPPRGELNLQPQISWKQSRTHEPQ